MGSYSANFEKGEQEQDESINRLSKTGMDYRTWLQQRKQRAEMDNSEDAMGSKFEITRKTNSTILEESSKAEDDDSIIKLENRHEEVPKPTHVSKKSDPINPMLLLTNTEQTSAFRPENYQNFQNMTHLQKFSHLQNAENKENHNVNIQPQVENGFPKRYLQTSSFRSSNTSGNS